MDKHIQVKYKIQNVDGQTHTYETKNTKFGWTNTYKWNIKYKIWIDKHKTVKYKIQNMDGQTHNSEI